MPPSAHARQATDAADPVTWFDSSWELRQGLDVAELDEASQLLQEWHGRLSRS